MKLPAIACHGLTKDYGAGRGVFDLDLTAECGEVPAPGVAITSSPAARARTSSYPLSPTKIGVKAPG